MSTRTSGRKRAASPAPAAAASSSTKRKTASVAVPAAKKSKTKVEAKPAAAAAAAAAAASSSSSEVAPLAAALALSGLERVPASATGAVFAFGSGDCSQLGLGAEENMRERKKPTALKALAGQNIAAIAAGSLHNLVLVRDGASAAAGSAKSAKSAKAGSGSNAVWSWGCNDDQALGRSSDEWLPAPVDGPLGQGSSEELPGGVVQIACGASHSIALSATGDVYSWGTYRDANGVIGFSDTIDAATRPHQLTTLPKGVKVVQIGAGEHHDILLTEQGEVYQWGDIGIGRRFSDRHKKNKLNPSRVVFKRAGGVAPPKRIESVFAGGHSNFALDADGTAWFWGPNNYNQAGRANPDKNNLMVLIPEPVQGLPPLAKVACATHHSLFLTRDGSAVYSCGRGEDGRLGHGDSKNYVTPTLIAALSNLPNGDKVVDINAGECHSLVTTKLGRLYSFGYGDLLQLGNGVETDVPAPYLLQSKEIDEGGAKGLGRVVVQAAGGAQHSIILTIERTEAAPWAAAKAAAPAAAAASSAAPAAAASSSAAAAAAASSSPAAAAQ